MSNLITKQQSKILILFLSVITILLILFYYFILITSNFLGNTSIVNEGILSFFYSISMEFNVFLLPLILILILLFNVFSRKSLTITISSILSVVVYLIPFILVATLPQVSSEKNIILIYLLLCLVSYSLTIILSCLACLDLIE